MSIASEETPAGGQESVSSRFKIYRRENAPLYEDTDISYFPDLTAVSEAGLAKFVEAGGADGSLTKILFNGPGFSLVYAWFKSGYALPLHSHDADCLYYVVAGSTQVGTEVLNAGDGFFVGTDVPYTHTAGAEGVELLEFRHAQRFDTRFPSNNPKGWDRLADRIRESHPSWDGERMPSLLGA